MKELYLIKNTHTDNYICYEGENQHNRVEVSVKKGLEQILERVDIDPKRKAILYVEGFSEDEFSKLKKYLKKTKVDIKYS